MAKRIKVRRKEHPITAPSQEEVLEWNTESGTTYTVGEPVLVQHPSLGERWHELVLKRITIKNGSPTFHFYSQPPGMISVTEERLKRVKKKRVRINKGE